MRPLLYQQYESDPDFLMVKGHILEEDYIKLVPIIIDVIIRLSPPLAI